MAPLLYIDPIAGGMLLQIILGGLTGVLVLGRLFWKSLWAWAARVVLFRRKGSGDQGPEADGQSRPPGR